MGEEEFKNWLRKMYIDNCSERTEHNQTHFENAAAYYRAYPVWLKEQYKKHKGEK